MKRTDREDRERGQRRWYRNRDIFKSEEIDGTRTEDEQGSDRSASRERQKDARTKDTHCTTSCVQIDRKFR